MDGILNVFTDFFFASLGGTLGLAAGGAILVAVVLLIPSRVWKKIGGARKA